MKTIQYIVTLGFDRVSVKALVSKVRNTVTMMTGNTAYPTPEPPLATITELVDKLATADEAYDFNRGKLEKDERDLYFQYTKMAYRNLGAYVQVTSNGDKETILSGGFGVRRSAQPKGIPPAPKSVVAFPTHYPRQVEVRWGASKGRFSYKVFRTMGDPTMETGWELIAVTGKTRLLVDGLERFQTYSFRIVAVGAAGASPASDAASATAA
jgi:hypothetical protein